MHMGASNFHCVPSKHIWSVPLFSFASQIQHVPSCASQLCTILFETVCETVDRASGYHGAGAACFALVVYVEIGRAQRWPSLAPSGRYLWATPRFLSASSGEPGDLVFCYTREPGLEARFHCQHSVPFYLFLQMFAFYW